MKKIAILGTILVVVMVLSTLAVAMPTSAEPDTVFETSIVPGAFCDDPISKGEVKVNSNGDFELEMEGATPGQTYTVYVGQWAAVTATRGGIDWYPAGSGASSIGTFTIDEDGEGKLSGTLPAGTWSIIAINDDTETPANEFVSGTTVTAE